MRRFLTLVSLLCLAIPAGITITGCTHNPGAKYCNGLGYGPKVDDVAQITLQPEHTGVSMAWGQTRQLSSPSATTCKGVSAAVIGNYIYGTTNNQLVDISPTGNLCAGTWNRNTGGGIADYTECSAPSPLPNTNGLPYSSAYVTATADAVTSNPVAVYVHAAVTSLSLVGPTQCLSQGTQWSQPLDVQACYTNNNKSYLLCAPASVTTAASPSLACPLPSVNGKQVALSSIPTCPASIGALSFNVGTSLIASINQENNTITANQPGTTVITANIANSGSSAGYFSTCPPASISVTLADGSQKGTITQGVTQNLVTKVVDTNGQTITGLSLDYQSTDQVEITASSNGSLQASYPGQASVYAICQPPSCNPSPTNVIGRAGSGLPISSNPVNVTVPGTASDYLWFGAPGLSQYVVPVELISGSVGSTVRLPYVPNSMVMDKLGNNIYFGSDYELMVYSTSSNSVSSTSTAYPGVVLAVSPTSSEALINDRSRKIFYLTSAQGVLAGSFNGVGYAAAWTPDGKTLYIVGEGPNAANITVPQLIVYNVNTGWSTHDLSATGAASNVAVTIPGVGAYLSGNPTVAHTWCPQGTAGNYASMDFYPLGDQVPTQTDVLAATTDGAHILGAAVNSGNLMLDDIGVTIPTDKTTGLPEACQISANGTLLPLEIAHTLNTLNLTQVSATAVNQVVTGMINQTPNSPGSSLAFVTYTGSTPGALLPYYLPGTGGAAGTVKYLTLAGGNEVTAPIAGAFSPDNKLFFVSTAGDNKVHYISVPTLTDTQQISPKLPACAPGTDSGCKYTGSDPVVPASVIEVKPRQTT